MGLCLLTSPNFYPYLNSHQTTSLFSPIPDNSTPFSSPSLAMPPSPPSSFSWIKAIPSQTFSG